VCCERPADSVVAVPYVFVEHVWVMRDGGMILTVLSPTVPVSDRFETEMARLVCEQPMKRCCSCKMGSIGDNNSSACIDTPAQPPRAIGRSGPVRE
jgi:hypothetical protein